jgi:ketopantoate reductase
LKARDVSDGRIVEASVEVVPDPSTDTYDLVLVAVTRDQLAAACAPLTALVGAPAIVLLGNGAARGLLTDASAGRVYLGFPGIGGGVVDGTVEYVNSQPISLRADSPFSVSTTWTVGSSTTPYWWRASVLRCTDAGPTRTA